MYSSTVLNLTAAIDVLSFKKFTLLMYVEEGEDWGLGAFYNERPEFFNERRNSSLSLI